MTGALGQQPPAAGPTGAGADPGDGGDGHVPDLRQLTPGGVPHDALPIDASQLTQGVDVQGVGRPGRPAAVGRIGVGGQEPARVPGELSPAGPVVLADPPPRSVVGQDLSTRPTTVGARASATGGAGIMRRVVPSVGDGVLGVGGRGGQQLTGRVIGVGGDDPVAVAGLQAAQGVPGVGGGDALVGDGTGQLAGRVVGEGGADPVHALGGHAPLLVVLQGGGAHEPVPHHLVSDHAVGPPGPGGLHPGRDRPRHTPQPVPLKVQAPQGRVLDRRQHLVGVVDVAGHGPVRVGHGCAQPVRVIGPPDGLVPAAAGDQA